MIDSGYGRAHGSCLKKLLSFFKAQVHIGPAQNRPLQFFFIFFLECFPLVILLLAGYFTGSLLYCCSLFALLRNLKRFAESGPQALYFAGYNFMWAFFGTFGNCKTSSYDKL
jgi:hypothetical protein